MIRLPRKVLCVDWDKRALRLVVARIGGGAMELEDAHSHRLPHTVDCDDPESMGAFIAQSLKRHHWHHKRVIVDVPRDKSVINRLSLPPTPDNELAAAVRFQAMRELPFSLDEAVIDYVVLRRDENNRAVEVLLAAVRTEALDRLRETCVAAGLTPARIGLRPYAILVSVVHLPSMADRRVLFVDVGPTMTEIDVINRGALCFSRSANVNIPVRGGELLSDDSRISSKAELEDVESTDEAAVGAIDQLVVEIVRTLQAYRATEPDAAVNRIVVGGGTGIEPELLKAVGRRFGLPTEMFDPTGPLAAKESEAVKLRSFAAALGLAWGLSKEGLLELDFLNPKKPVPPRENFKKRARTASIAAAMVVTAVGVFFGKAYMEMSAALTEVRKEVSSLQEDRDELAKTEFQNQRVTDWVVEAVWLDDLLHLSEQMVDRGGSNPDVNTHMIAKGLSFDARKGTLSIDVECRDNKTFLEFVERLNELGGGKRYNASVGGSWREGSTSDPAFKGSSKVKVEVVRLVLHRATADKREKARRKVRDAIFTTAFKPAAKKSSKPRSSTSRPPASQPAATRPAAAQPTGDER